MSTRSVLVQLRLDNQQFMARLGQSSAAVKAQAGQIESYVKKNSQAMTEVGQVTLAAGAAIAAGMGLAVKAAVDWESQWAGVTKTVDGNAQQMKQLEGELRGLTKVLPASHQQIAAVAEAAGQLGVKRESIAGFTKTMVDLGETTNLTAEDAATAIAQIANVMGTAPDEIDRFGASLVALGNAGASTEAEILNMAQRLSGAGKLVGASEADILALANAMASMGIEAELGGGAMSRTILDIEKAVAGGADSIAGYAEVAGMSAQEFATMWEGDPVRAVDAFVQGLNRIDESGGSAVTALDDLGIKGTQDMQVLLRLKGAQDLLGDSLDLGAKAWKENSALTDEANKRYETTQAKLQIARNSVRELAIELGGPLLDALGAGAEMVVDMASAFDKLPGPMKAGLAILGSLAGVVGILGGAALLVIPQVAALKVALVDLGVTSTVVQAKMAATRAFLLGPWGLAIGAAITAITVFSASKQGATEDIDAFVQALEADNDVLGDNARRTAAAALEKKGLLKVAQSLGLDLGMVTAAALGDADAMDEVTRATQGAWAAGIGHDGSLSESAQSAKALERELTGLSGSLDEAGKARKRQAEAEGEAAAEAAAAAAREREAAIRLAEATGERVVETEKVADASGEAATATDKLATATNNAYDGIVAFTQAKEFDEDQTKALTKQIEEWADALAGFVSPLGAYTDLLDQKRTAEEEAAKKREEELGKEGDSWEQYVGEYGVGVDEYLVELERQVQEQEKHSDNLLRLAGKVSQGTLDELARMGPEGAPLVADLVNASDAELDKLDDLFGRRTKEATGAMAAELYLAQTLLPQLASVLGEKTVTALALELSKGTTTVAEIASTYSWALNEGIKPLLKSLGLRTVESLVRRDSAAAARGGMQPAVRRAFGGPVWGAGTATSDSIPAYLSNGEYVIRASSVARYGHDFLDQLNEGRYAVGGLVRRFAAGGFASASAVPKPPTSGMGGPPVSTAASATMDLAYRTAVQAVQALAPQLMSVTGGASAKGLNPQFLAMFNAYNQAIGNVLRITSGWRSSAQQAVLYRRWMNRVPGQAPAAPPGRSNHERGMAIDHSPHSNPRMRAVAGAHGLRYPMSYEPWHVEPARIRRSSGGPVRRLAQGGPIGRARAGAIPPGYVRAEDGSLVPLSFYAKPKPAPAMHGRSLTDVTKGLTDPAKVRETVKAWEDYNRELTRNRALLSDAQAAQYELKVAKNAEQRAAAQRKVADANKAIADQQSADRLDRERDAVDKLVDSLEKQADATADVKSRVKEAREEQKRAAEQARGDAQRTRDDALGRLNELLDRERSINGQRAEVEQQYAEKLAAVQQRRADAEAQLRADSARAAADLAREQQELLDRRRVQLEGWARLDERASVGWGNSVEQLLANARDQAGQFEEWMASLADARRRGVSEQVIASLGLDAGPEALGQLRQFGQATTAEIDALNAEVARRTTLAGEQTSREQQAGLSALGRDLTAAQQQYVDTLSALQARYREDQAALDEEMVQAQADLLVRQAELATELAALGQEQGRSYGDAIAAGMRSTISGILAAAQAVAAAQQQLAVAEAATKPKVDIRAALARRATFDSGGWLQPGYTLAFNGTGAPERVLGPQSSASGTSLTININGPVFGVDDLHRQIRSGADALLAEKRDAALAHGAR